ncbi:MAG: DNA-binding protein [Ignavibacteriae bacterium]|nr:DNA-binding protein [Ignavibacteriota bacterium]
MKSTYLGFILLLMLMLIIGCGKTEVQEEVLPEGTNKIEVVEHMNGGGYTYIKGEENGKEVWVAVREMPVEKGDVYYYSNAMEMNNFESKTLNKTFASILFANNISKKSSGTEQPKSNLAPISGHSKPEVDTQESINVAPLSNGQTVKSIFAEKEKLKNKTIKIKGIVTKYNGGIMGKNWLHIQDGTNLGSNIDITVTSSQSAKVGETVVVEGTLTLDKDFGSGYFYDAIIENASITVEKTI